MGSCFRRRLGLVVFTISCACLIREKVIGRQPDRLLRPCKVPKRHADACTPADLYQRVGGFPPAYGPAFYFGSLQKLRFTGCPLGGLETLKYCMCCASPPLCSLLPFYDTYSLYILTARQWLIPLQQLLHITFIYLLL